MSLKRRSQFASLIAIMASVLVVLTAGVVIANPATPVLYLSETDTTAKAGSEDAWISVFLANYQDTLAGFSIRIILDNPDLVEFKTDIQDSIYDTTFQYCDGWDLGVCTLWVDTMFVDTVIQSGAIDTVGTLISNWEYVTARSLSPSRHDIKITGLADQLGMPYTPGLVPRSQAGLLFRMNVRTYAETADSSDNVVNFTIIANLSETNFSDPHGELIGTITNYNFVDTSYWFCETWDGPDCTSWIDTTEAFADSIDYDTSFYYWFCQNWDADSCTEWQKVTGPDDTAAFADSISIDSTAWTVLDTANTFYISGSMTIDYSSCLCGDFNDDDRANVGDAVYQINFVFKGGPGPVDPSCGDVNGDGRSNVGDAVYMIQFVFKGGDAPFCN